MLANFLAIFNEFDDFIKVNGDNDMVKIAHIVKPYLAWSSVYIDITRGFNPENVIYIHAFLVKTSSSKCCQL